MSGIGNRLMTPPVFIQFAAPRRGVPAVRSLRTWAWAALDGAAGELTLRIVGEAEGRRLNARYRHHRQATNVLSFASSPLPDGSRPLLGDLVICAPVVMREAAEQGKPARAHWAHLVVHGCLHLLGYDHQYDTQAERMEAREREILLRLGFPDPYRVPYSYNAGNDEH